MKKRAYVIIFPLLFLVVLAFTVCAIGAEDSITETAADKADTRNILILEDDMPALFFADIAKAYTKYRKYDRAIEFYELAVKKAEKSVNIAELYHGLGMSYRRKGRNKEAVDYLEKAFEHAPDTGLKTDYSYDLASAYKSNKQVDKALEAYRFVVNSPKTSVWKEDARKRIFLIYREQNLLAEYISKFEQQIKEDPNDFEANMNLAEIYASAKFDPVKAVPYFEKAHKLDPENKDVIKRLALTYQNARQYEKAIELYKIMTEEAPEDKKVSLCERISSLYSRLGRGEEACEWIEKTLEFGKKDTYSYARVASIYARFKDYEKAVEMYEHAIDAGKEPQQKEFALFQLGTMYENIMKLDKAEEVYSTIINNDYKSYIDNLAKDHIEQIRKFKEQKSNYKNKEK